MARQRTTSDAFNAVAEPRRRQLIDVLAREREPQTVTAIVVASRMPQPMVSKHLAVLRAVGLVRVHQRGRERLYELDAEPLKHVHAWVQSFERFWDEHLDAIKQAAENKARSQAASQTPGASNPEKP